MKSISRKRNKPKPELLPKSGEVHLFLVGKKCYATVLADDLEDLDKGVKEINWSAVKFTKQTKKDLERDKMYEEFYGVS